MTWNKIKIMMCTCVQMDNSKRAPGPDKDIMKVCLFLGLTMGFDNGVTSF